MGLGRAVCSENSVQSKNWGLDAKQAEAKLPPISDTSVQKELDKHLDAFLLEQS